MAAQSKRNRLSRYKWHTKLASTFAYGSVRRKAASEPAARHLSPPRGNFTRPQGLRKAHEVAIELGLIGKKTIHRKSK